MKPQANFLGIKLQENNKSGPPVDFFAKTKDPILEKTKLCCRGPPPPAARRGAPPPPNHPTQLSTHVNV
jgi:hypothetical protein